MFVYFLQKSCRSKMFTQEEIQMIRDRCKSIINGGQINRERIEEALDEGFLKRYNWVQIRPRLTYERKLKEDLSK